MNKPKFESNEVLAERFMDEDIEIPNLFSSLDELLVFISQFARRGAIFVDRRDYGRLYRRFFGIMEAKSSIQQ